MAKGDITHVRRHQEDPGGNKIKFRNIEEKFAHDKAVAIARMACEAHNKAVLRRQLLDSLKVS